MYTDLNMKTKSNLTNKIYLVGLFSIAGFVLSQIAFTKLVGSTVSFTLFDFFAPTTGAFLGGGLGVISVLTVNLVNFIIKGALFSPAGLGRIITNLFAVWYFSSKVKNKNVLAIPILAMVLFWLNPVGREVWYYALFWTIPVIAYLKRDNLFLKSLGATFTAHAVGGAIWIWTMGLPATVWRAIIPLTAIERISFAFGISASYVIMTYALKYLEAKNIIPAGLKIKASTKHIYS